MLNQISVMGRLVAAPELKQTPAGVPVCSFRIACDRDYKPKDGERETDFINIVAWRSTAEFVSKFFSKGRMAVVSGRLQIRPYTDKEGNKRTAAEVVANSVYFGDTKPKGNNDQEPPAYHGEELPGDFVPDLDDENDGELPF